MSIDVKQLEEDLFKAVRFIRDNEKAFINDFNLTGVNSIQDVYFNGVLTQITSNHDWFNYLNTSDVLEWINQC